MKKTSTQHRGLVYSIIAVAMVVCYCHRNTFCATTTSNIVYSFQFHSIAQRSVTQQSKVASVTKTAIHNSQLLKFQRPQPSSSSSSSNLSASELESTPSPTTTTTTSATASVPSLPTLSSDTTWMIRMTLRNIKTQQGQTLSNQMYVIYGQFIPEDNYEPPQGTFVQQPTSTESTTTSDTSSNDDNTRTAGDGGGMQIASSRWILSEDPNDRKDGLWIWGLFQQPLYPYMLLSLETKPIEIRSGRTSSDDTAAMDYIPALQLYVQLDHTCNRDTGAVSFGKKKKSGSTLSDTTTGSNNYELMIRQKEIIAADPLSLSKVEIYEEVSIGTISIQPK